MKTALISVVIVLYVVAGLFSALVYGASETKGKVGPTTAREWTMTALAGVFWPVHLAWAKWFKRGVA